MIEKNELLNLYITERLSMQEIAKQLNCSQNSVVYWMNKHQINRRTISEAVYTKNNPNGDPFILKPINSREKAKLLGMGLGLYWGEGNKANKHSVRLGNTDPELIKTFVTFLEEIFAVKRQDMKFGLQIFSDIDPELALSYWLDQLNVNRSQFYKITVTISGSIGTYRAKSKYGVLTVYYHNKKLRDLLVGMLPR